MINIEEIKQKILSLLKERGPSLPIPISRAVALSPIFSSAILSEMLNEKTIKTSNLRIGSSPLYLLPGQEQTLEDFSSNLTGVEKEAFLKLKQNKVLKDETQEPATRVALRSIKDFAIPIKYQDKIFWKYFKLTNEEAAEILTEKKTSKEAIQKFKPDKEMIMQSSGKKEERPILEAEKSKSKSSVQKKDLKFLEEIKQFLAKKDIELLREIQTNEKEISAIIRINSDLGKIKLFLTAKNKKRITEADLTLAYQKALNEKMACFFLSKGEPSKKTQEFLESHKNLIKIEKI